ncbi:hypothetical protein AGR8A_Lc40376 [Agrobacterium fabrum str. J-07]|nr:hypothetical protein AGR8A_Lc40376 [Agrobacterium fabrum str. J-07]
MSNCCCANSRMSAISAFATANCSSKVSVLRAKISFATVSGVIRLAPSRFFFFTRTTSASSINTLLTIRFWETDGHSLSIFQRCRDTLVN